MTDRQRRRKKKSIPISFKKIIKNPKIDLKTSEFVKKKQQSKMSKPCENNNAGNLPICKL